VVGAFLHWLGGNRIKVKSRSPASSRLSVTALPLSRHLRGKARRRTSISSDAVAQISRCSRPQLPGAAAAARGRSGAVLVDGARWVGTSPHYRLALVRPKDRYRREGSAKCDEADGHGMRVISQSPGPLARMHTMTDRKGKSGTIDVKALLAGGRGVSCGRWCGRRSRGCSKWR
jgi:hypothetical protein